MNTNKINVKVGDKVGIKSKWNGGLRMEVVEIRDGEVKLKKEHGKNYEAEWYPHDEIVTVLPKFDFFPYNFVPFEEKVWRARLNFYIVERALDNLRHEFAKDIFNPLSMGIWEIWGIKAIKAIKNDGRNGLFNYLRDFAKYVVENIRNEEELKAFLAHNLKHVNGYSVEEFNEELKKEITHNINNSFEWDGSDSYETYGSVKRAYGNWDEFFVILKESFEDYINENF